VSRGFFLGLLWGLVVCTAGLGVVSLVAPKRAVPAELAAKAVPVAEPEASQVPAVPEVQAEGSGQEAEASESAVAQDANEAVVESADGEAAIGASETGMAVVEPAAVPATVSAAEPLEQIAQPEVPAAQAQELPMATEAGAAANPPISETAPDLPLSEPVSPTVPGADIAPTPDAGTMPAPHQDKLLDPPAAPPAQSDEAVPELPQAEPATETALLQVPAAPQAPATDEKVADLRDAPLPEPDQPATEAPAAETMADDAAPGALPDVQIAMDDGLDKQVPGVTTDRLPRIGDAEPAEPALEALALEAAEQPPLLAFARPFAAEAGVPLFAILLHDIGAAGMSREDLANLPFAVTFVIDPSAPDAAEAAQAYRAAGQEVMIEIGALPEGATPADLEQSFQSLALALPQAVAMLDAAAGGLQENRPLATQAIPILKAQGRGIVTYDLGLGAADQVAQREGLAHASIFRTLDAEGEATAVIRRYLDRAAFKAAQEGQVLVIGQTRPETVAAILEWMVEGRGSSVQLAPVTALMAAE
jgi:polysaccharide deacetylase 2 family uncharacterized protein YibQ